jgi:hypothetical protein
MDRPIVPEDLSSLSTEELEALATSLREFYTAQRAASTPNVEDLRFAASGLQAIGAFQAAQVALAAEIEGMDAAVNPPEAPPPDPVVPAVDPPAPAPVVAAPIQPSELTPPPGGEVIPAAPTMTRDTVLVAAAGLPGVDGASILPFGDFATTMQKVAESRQGVPNAPQVTVASIRGDFDEELRVGPRLGAAENRRRFTEALKARREARGNMSLEEKALVATGGLCGPAQPYRNINVIGCADRPVAGAITTLPAERGQIIFTRAPSLADVADAVDVKTSAQDEAGGAGAIKSCFALECAPTVTTQIRAITACMTYGVLQDLSNPEWVAANIDVILRLWARTGETALLDDLVTFSGGILVDISVLGSLAADVRALNRAAAHYRGPERFCDVDLTWLVPFWKWNQWRADLGATPFYAQQACAADAEIICSFEAIGVSVVPYLDSATLGGALLPAQVPGVAGELDEFPVLADTFLFADSVVARLDSGGLDFGFMGGEVIRDSTLIKSNDQMIFTEIFESLVFLGGGPVWNLRLNSCSTGARSEAVDPAITCVLP